MIRVFTLGAARIETVSTGLNPAATKRFALVLHLIAERGRRTPRATLFEYLFEGFPDARAQHSLRELVYRLRQSGIDIDGNSHGLALDPSLVHCDWIDVLSTARIEAPTFKAIQAGFLTGYAPTISTAFSERLDALRTTEGLELAKACLRAIEPAKKTDDWERVEQAARACLTLDPLNGIATTALARALAIRGSAKEAMRLLDSYASELGPEAGRLAMPVAKLRQRIGETFTDGYARSDAFPFAGREHEMSALTRAFGEAKRGGPRCVLLSGEPGIGKSRIATEFALRASIDGCAIVRTNAHPQDRQRPMGAVIDLVPMLLKQHGAPGCSPESMTWLNLLMGRKAAKPDTERELSNAQTAHAIARAFVDVIGAIASESPLAIVIDDAQWVDDTSLTFLRDVVSGRRPSGLLVVLTSRDERAVLSIGDWGEAFVACTVGPLDRCMSTALIEKELTALGEDDRSLSEWMAEVAGGNPFYVDTLITHYRTTRERFVIPSQLSAIVDQRVRALTDGARDVLETIVALGKRATLTRIERILETRGPALVRSMRELGATRLITGDLEVKPAHWLIVESVQRNAIPSSQRLLYRHIAAALESELSVSGDSAELWECSEAWVAAGNPERAAAMMATCAEHALSIGRAKEAADLYYRAATTVDDGTGERYAEASVRAAIDGGEAERILRAIRRLTSRKGKRRHDDIELAEVRALLWSDEDVASRLSTLAECFQEGTASLHHRLIAARSFLTICENGRIVDSAVAVRQSIAALIERITESESDENDRLLCSAVYHGLLGDIDRLSGIADHLVARSMTSRADGAVALLRVGGSAFLRVGDMHGAIDAFERAHTVCSDSGLEHLAAEFQLTLASQYLDAGQLEPAQRWLDLVQPRSELASPYVGRVVWEIKAELAWSADADRAVLEACDEVAARASAEMALRPRRRAHALRYLASHIRAEPIDLQRLAIDLTEHQVAGYEFGYVGDFEMAVLGQILCERGAIEAARLHFDEYLQRTRAPEPILSHSLLRVSRQFDLLDPIALQQRYPLRNAL